METPFPQSWSLPHVGTVPLGPRLCPQLLQRYPAPPVLGGHLLELWSPQQPPPFFGKAPHFAKRGHVPLAPMGFTLGGVTPSPSQVFGSQGDEYLKQRTVVP